MQNAMRIENEAPNLLPRILTKFDLTAIYFALIFASYGAAQMASMGWAAVPMLLLATILFLLPCAIAAYRLGTVYTGEGGIYIWAQKAFGPVHGFISGWLSWVPILLLLPLGVTTTTAHIQAAFHTEWSKPVDIFIQITLIWLEVFICTQRLVISQKFIKIGFFVSIGTAAIVFIVSILQPHAATPITADITSVNIFSHGALFSAAVLWLLGVEMPFTMGAEYGDHKRTARTMLTWGTLAIVAGYLMGIIGILYALPQSQIDVTKGVAQAVIAHYPLLGSGVAIAIWFAVMSQDIAYLNTYSRLLFVSAIEKRLPAYLGHVSRKQVPVRALLVQGVGATLIVLVFANQASLATAFNLYLASLVVIWCASLYYIYGALLHIEKNLKNLIISVWGVAANSIAIYYVFALPWVSNGITAIEWRSWIGAIVAGIIILGMALWAHSQRLVNKAA